MSKTTSVLVAGRALSEYRRTVQAPAESGVVRDCLFCNQAVVITPEGARKLEGAPYPSGAICPPCARHVLPTLKNATFGGVTGDSAAVLEKSANARRRLDELKGLLKR